MKSTTGIRRSIKEALDNLPCGICFFSRMGVPVLYNHVMYQVVFVLTGRDLQSLDELQKALSEKSEGEAGDTCPMPDGTVWRFVLSQVTNHYGKSFTQVIAYDVTDLYRGAKEMEANVEKLKEVSAYIRSITENVATLTKEEELLSMKMQVHDRLGSSLLKLRRFVSETGGIDKEAFLADWRKTVMLLKHEAESENETDAYEELLRIAASIGVEVEMTGEMPGEELPRQLLVHALRQCITNAVRHAESTRVYMDITREQGMVRASITNDGKPPKQEIREGGGLAALRSRLVTVGGTMEVRSLPQFELTVTVPEKGDIGR